MLIFTHWCSVNERNFKRICIICKRSKSYNNIYNCFLHRKALVSKTIGLELSSVLEMVVRSVNYIKVKRLKCRQFFILCESMWAEYKEFFSIVDTLVIKWKGFNSFLWIKKRNISKLKQWKFDRIRLFFDR